MINRVNSLEQWQPSTCNCPNCGKNNTLVNTGMVLATYPPQYNYKCRDCGHAWTGYPNIDIKPMQSWPNLETEEPKYQGETGWICPKCGGVYSPSMKYCMNCTQFKTPTVTCYTGDFVQGMLKYDPKDTTVGSTDGHLWYTTQVCSDDKVDAYNYYFTAGEKGEKDGN